MLDPLTLFLVLFAGTLLLAILALLALGLHEGELAAIYWPRALVFACIGSAGVAMVGVIAMSVAAWALGWGTRG